MPRPKWKPLAQMTPFARQVRQWMLRHREESEVTVPELAEISGVSKQTVWDWFQHDAKPRRQTVIQLAERTGLDVDELLRAAGLPDTRASASERRAAQRVNAYLQQLAEEAIRADTRLTPDEAATMIGYYRSLGPALLEAALADLAALAGEGAAEAEAPVTIDPVDQQDSQTRGQEAGEPGESGRKRRKITGAPA